MDFYRGGKNLKPRPRDLVLDPVTGFVLPQRGISVFNRPENLERFGGPYRVTNLPPELQIVQIGTNPNHFEIIPVRPMTKADFETALGKIVLVPVLPLNP